MKIDLYYLRPSTIARAVEETIVAGATGVARKAKSAKRSIDIEYRARSVVKMQRHIDAQASKLAAMSPAERERMAAEQREVHKRIDELLDTQFERVARRAAKRAEAERARAARA